MPRAGRAASPAFLERLIEPGVREVQERRQPKDDADEQGGDEREGEHRGIKCDVNRTREAVWIRGD